MLLGIRRIRIYAATQPIGAVLDAILRVVRVEIAKSVAKLAGGGTLVGGEIALRVAHLLLQLREIVCEALAFIGQLLRFLRISLLTVTIVGLAETSCEGRGTGHLAKLLLLIFFLLGEAISFVRHGVETAVGVLLLRATKKIRALREGGPPRGALRRCPAARGSYRHWLAADARRACCDARIGGICWPDCPIGRLDLIDPTGPIVQIDRIVPIGRFDRTGPLAGLAADC